jgi:hypothetical protein
LAKTEQNIIFSVEVLKNHRWERKGEKCQPRIFYRRMLSYQSLHHPEHGITQVSPWRLWWEKEDAAGRTFCVSRRNMKLPSLELKGEFLHELKLLKFLQSKHILMLFG